MSYYGKSVYEHKNNAEVIYPYAQTAIFARNRAELSDFWRSRSYGTPSRAMRDGASAKKYFEAVAEYHNRDYWQDLLGI